VFCSENSDDKESGIDTQVLYAQIGELNVQNELLKKIALRSQDERKSIVESGDNELSWIFSSL